GVQMIATLPSGMAMKSASGPVPFHLQGQQVLFEPVATLAARADALYRVRGVGQQAGDMRFKVHVTSDQVKTPITKEESTHVSTDPEETVTATGSGSWKPEAARQMGP